MSRTRKDVDASERMALVLRLLWKEEPAAQITRRAGIAESTLYGWRDAILEGGGRNLAGRGPDKAQKRELQKLRGALANRDQVIGELTIANRIPKKTVPDHAHWRRRCAVWRMRRVERTHACRCARCSERSPSPPPTDATSRYGSRTGRAPRRNPCPSTRAAACVALRAPTPGGGANASR